MDGWCLHELRHSYLSMLAEEGVHPKVMQELAGHASSKTTMDIYTHVNMDIKRAAAEVAADVFSRIGEEEKVSALMEKNGCSEKPATIIVLPGGRRRTASETTAVQASGRFEPDSNHPDQQPALKIVNGTFDQQFF